MECKKCKSKWESGQQVNNCPFCGASLRESIPNYVFTDVQHAIDYIVDSYGKEIILSGRKFLSILSDLTTGLEREKRLLKICFDSGVIKSMVEADNVSVTDQEIRIGKAAALLEDQFFIKQDTSLTALNWVSKSLGWSIDMNQETCFSFDSKMQDEQNYTAEIVKKNKISERSVYNPIITEKQQQVLQDGPHTNYLGKVIDLRYEIHEIIFVNSISILYKAYDRVEDRNVVVRVFRDGILADEDNRRRIKDEFTSIALLSHPNIAKEYNVSFNDKLQYIVMEYVTGITLKEYIERQRNLEWQEAVFFVDRVLRALQYAHVKGIIHRDIKPQNIMLCPDRHVKVTDFGITSLKQIMSQNDIKFPMGRSVGYSSPEQARGEYMDCRSDIYSVGVVLYEMLTGKLPLNTSFESVKWDESVPLGLQEIVLKSLKEDPLCRYQSAEEYISDLTDFNIHPNSFRVSDNKEDAYDRLHKTFKYFF